MLKQGSYLSPGSDGSKDISVRFLGSNAVWTSRQIRRRELDLYRWRQYVPPKNCYLATSPHDVSTQTTHIDKVHTRLHSF
jgi:hypothetical protein